MTGQEEAASSAYLTIEMLEAAFEQIRDAVPHPHGSEQNPHLANPARPDFCVECGWLASSGRSGGSDE